MTDGELLDQPLPAPEGANMGDLPPFPKEHVPRALEAQPLIDAARQRATEPHTQHQSRYLEQ